MRSVDPHQWVAESRGQSRTTISDAIDGGLSSHGPHLYKPLLFQVLTERKEKATVAID